MPIRWETFPVELSGGLVSNKSRLQHGLQQPGSARSLQNFETSIKGGYRRINGFVKYDSNTVPPYGSAVVQGSGQLGTTLLIADVHEAPAVGDVFTIGARDTVFTVTSVTYDSTGKSASLTVTPAITSISPPDKDLLTFSVGQSRIEGVHFSASEAKAYALRGGALWSSAGSGWTKVNTPSYGSPLVAGAFQTGTTLVVDALGSDTYVPQAGDTFSIAGLDLVYTLTANAVVSTGSSTLSITPALAGDTVDNAAITFLSSSLSGGSKAVFQEINFDNTFKTVMVDRANKPSIFYGSTFRTIQGVADVVGACSVEEFKDHLFLSKGALVNYSSPFLEEDFSSGNGAGSFRLPGACTGLLTFREQLVCFSETDIRKLTGTSSADFALTSVSNSVGSLDRDTVQEVGGDVLFLSADGVRFLGATDRIGDFNLSLASRQIQDKFETFITAGADFCTLTLKKKNQYRIFKYSESNAKVTSEGYIGTQFLDQDGQSLSWGLTRGIKAYRASSTYAGEDEISLFTNDDEHVYQMETGKSFDGTPIISRFYTPYMAVNDPSLRKTAYKVDTYYDSEGLVNGTLTLKYDFNRPDKIQPGFTVLEGGVGSFTTYSVGVYGTDTYGGSPATVVNARVIGSFSTVSLQYEFEGSEPFILDTMTLEYSTEDRK